MRSAGVDCPPASPTTGTACSTSRMATLVTARFADDRITFVRDFPASQAALARISGPVAARFEAFWGGLELANGFHELGDARSRRGDSQADAATRRARGQPARDGGRSVPRRPRRRPAAVRRRGTRLRPRGDDRGAAPATSTRSSPFPSNAPESRTEPASMHTLNELPVDKARRIRGTGGKPACPARRRARPRRQRRQHGGAALLEPAGSQLGGVLPGRSRSVATCCSGRSRASRRACASRSVAACAARPPRGARRSWCPTCTRSRVTSPATRRRTRRSSCR